jgi:hypothetical protein
MKTSENIAIILLILFACSYGCQNKPATLSEAEKETIKKEVRNEFDKIIRAANEHDARAMMEESWNSPDYLYAHYGTLSKGWDEQTKLVETIHNDPAFRTFTVDMDDINIRVISREAAMITGTGAFNNFPAESGPVSVPFALTLLMEKMSGKWLITVGHESSPGKFF